LSPQLPSPWMGANTCVDSLNVVIRLRCHIPNVAQLRLNAIPSALRLAEVGEPALRLDASLPSTIFA
jgi:hypothetical protein